MPGKDAGATQSGRERAAGDGLLSNRCPATLPRCMLPPVEVHKQEEGKNLLFLPTLLGARFLTTAF